MTLKEVCMSNYYVLLLDCIAKNNNLLQHCLFCFPMFAEELQKGGVITLEEMQQARSCMVNLQNFCKLFLSNVVGRQVYNRKIARETISCIATVSDEAFVLLCLVNSLARWKHEAEYPEEVQKVLVYTASPAEASKYGGWSEAAIHCFNELQQHIAPEIHRHQQGWRQTTWIINNSSGTKPKNQKKQYYQTTPLFCSSTWTVSIVKEIC
jgi:hypothetical protein